MLKIKEVQKQITFKEVWSDQISDCEEIPEETITPEQLRNACGSVGYKHPDGVTYRNFFVPKKRAPQYF